LGEYWAGEQGCAALQKMGLCGKPFLWTAWTKEDTADS
jgi:hypothetical protein